MILEIIVIVGLALVATLAFPKYEGTGIMQM